MRILFPRRIVGLGILLALLCLTPVISPPAFAKPISWEDLENPGPPAPKGDNDGVVVKAGSQNAQAASITAVTSVGRKSVWSWVQNYLRFVRWDYGSRLYP